MSSEQENSGSGIRCAAFRNREFPFTQRDFQQIVSIMHDDAGIALPDIKASLVYSRLVKRLRLLGLESFRDYCALIGQGNERGEMVAALTTNVTRFFREAHHFEHFKTAVLPPLVEGVRKGAPLRLWSAGCASGEEAYSLALSVLSLMPDAAVFDVKILATDINKNVLAAARRGIYHEQAIGPVGRRMRADWFRPERAADGTKSWHVGPELRRLVTFRELNLVAEWPMRRPFQAIFCRNVAIYFEDDVQTRLWDRLTSRLVPGGYLYVGHSERVTHSPLVPDGNTIYRAGLRRSSQTSEHSHA